MTLLHRWVSLWRREFHVYRSLDRGSAEMRARLLAAVSRLTPLMMVTNLINGAVLVAVGHGHLPTLELALWTTALVVLCGWGFWRSWRRRDRRTVTASPRAIHHAVRNAALLSLLWGSATMAWFARSDGDHQLVLAVLVLGMMCGGAFTLAAVPWAALLYIGLLSLASEIGLLSSTLAVRGPVACLLIAYTATLMLSVLATARLITARLASEREASRQSELVGLLLRDFEEHSSDLLWEVGADGRLTHVSPRFAQALGRVVPALQAQTLVEALSPHDATHEAAGHQAALRSALVQGKAFRDLVVPVHTTSGLRWWSLSAKPLLDDGAHHAGWRGVITDVTQARESHRRLAMLAHFDSLTGLANRLQLRERLAQALEPEPAGGGVPNWALMCLDVDHFKTINDTLGHAVGDAVLIKVGERLRACVRPNDLVARMGGDEFALLVSAAHGVDDVAALARRIVQTLCQPCSIEGRQINLGVSIGVALAQQHGHGLDELIGNADLALYAAKDAGRARFEVFSPRLGDRRRRKIAVEQALRGAAGRGEFELAWQPRVEIDGWQLTGAEALARWRHPELGVVSPVEFIASAEESGAILEIGAWVLEQACLDAARLDSPLVVSVNASPVQLMKPDFLALTRAALERSGLAPQRLEIEVTESLFLGDSSTALANLHALRELGVRVALDDFGTGYSSLAYLRKFPFDTLKIDRAFVMELMTRHDARAIVRSIIELARTLGMHTLAEGVEEPAQLEVLREVQCGGVQGFLVARPMPLVDLQRVLANWQTEAPRGSRMMPLRVA